MKAIVWTKYGPPDVLQLKEVKKPEPGDHEVLIKIHAVTVTAGDCEMRKLAFPYWLNLPMRLWVGFRKPKRVTILGAYLAGEIEAVGKGVKLFKAGEQVFGMAGAFAANAEYVCIPEQGTLTLKPANMTYEEAAPVALGGLESLHFLRKGNIQPGQQILISGAGGGIGTYGIQLAKHFRAEVTAVDSTEKFAMLRAIGADHVIDYTQEDFTKNGRMYDIIFDVVGKSPFSRSVRSLKENGRYLIANPSGFIQFVRGKWTSSRSGKKVIFTMNSPKTEDLLFLKELIEAGKIKTVIDRQYPLEQIPEAHRYIESGHKKGNVVITMAHNNET